MLKMSGVAKAYTTDTIQTQALQPFDLDVEQGEFIAVVGPSGSGKTTFLNILGLLEDPCEGQYYLDGEAVLQLKDRQKSRLRNSKIGIIFQSFNLLPELSVYDNVEVPLRYRSLSAKERKNRVMTVLDKVGLTSRAHHKPHQLSGGQQQRAAIARALVGEPTIVLADEPTGNLDSSKAEEIMSLLQSFNSHGTTILMVTHDPILAMRAKRTIEIRDGVLKERSGKHYAARWRTEAIA
ncbi:ABC transporter ATP-binding protein [Pseudoalteromonas luteoviolacea]|uniref:ABC transporter ATP-binding protein n=1 Tax=Pseudoalteromonas luteoviolacea TaxID=43657 RepID=A0A1C0TMZ3_9GAMM|nr:ABC transporter ATP-binding protein [Pseudoalteromonas luteoviolacea]OCQ20035.1 ABC transporter ATP-binding protein [Pseudoalteromonas luteoviolacea]